jgi:DNA-binding NtrC family response regulator
MPGTSLRTYLAGLLAVALVPVPAFGAYLGVMPGGMDGFDLVHANRQRWPRLPVLLTRRYSEATSWATAETFEIVPQPYRPDDLVSAIERALARGRDRSANVGRLHAPR